MKNFVEKTAILMCIILLSYCYTSCNNGKTTNNKVVRFDEKIAKNEVEIKTLKTSEPIVFITGFDKGKETFYNDARNYFKDLDYKIIEDQYSLEEIINWLNNNETELSYGEIHIVNKSDSFKGMTLETLVRGDKVTSETLRRVITKGELPILNESVDSSTKIILHANGLGENSELMSTFKDAFFAEELPTVIASPYYSIFNGEFSKHYLAKAYFVFYPTANSPGKIDLSKEIARKYTNEKDIDWYDALKNYEERYVGEAYTTQLTIPVKFDLDYHNSDEAMPNFNLQEEVIEFIRQKEELYSEIKKLNIPIEKFKWSWKVKNSSLTIKGNTTCLTVLKPLIKPYGELEHVKPDTKNKRLYAMK